MGREMKRVALDFTWPKGKVWEGFINPFCIECSENCDGGFSKEYILLKQAYYKDHVHLTEEQEQSPVLQKLLPHIPEIKERGRFDFYGRITEKAEQEGLSDDWNTCKVCDGKGIHSDFIEKYENWKKVEPPTGEGYQLWETTSEGSPKSPVFETLEALCEWCEKNATTFASFTATKKEWMTMLNDEFVHHKEGNTIFL